MIGPAAPLVFENAVEFSPGVVFVVATTTEQPVIQPTFQLFIQLDRLVIPLLLAAELLDFSNRLPKVLPVKGVSVCSFLLDSDTFMGYAISHSVLTFLPETMTAVLQSKLVRMAFLLHAFTYRGGLAKLVAKLSPLDGHFRITRVSVYLPANAAALGININNTAVVSIMSYFLPGKDAT